MNFIDASESSWSSVNSNLVYLGLLEEKWPDEGHWTFCIFTLGAPWELLDFNFLLILDRSGPDRVKFFELDRSKTGSEPVWNRFCFRRNTCSRNIKKSDVLAWKKISTAAKEKVGLKFSSYNKIRSKGEKKYAMDFFFWWGWRWREFLDQVRESAIPPKSWADC